MGQKYAILDKVGFPIAFYDTDIHGDNIPTNAIEITEEQWIEFINNQGRRYFDFETKQIKEFNPETMKIIDNKVVFKTEDEILQEKRTVKENQLKSLVGFLLSQTDWVIVKLQSLRDEGWSDAEIQAEIQKYQTVFDRRRAIREWNLQIEQAIQKVQTIEELEGIKIEFEG